MYSPGKYPGLVALLLVFVFISGCYNVSAINRVSGQFWTYDVSMPVAGLNASGSATFELSGEDAVVANGVSYNADVLAISGNLSASSTLFGVPYTVSTALGGVQFKSRGGVSTIGEDSFQWTNMSIGAAPVQLLARIQTEIISTFGPPYLSKFDPATTRPGDTWREDIVVNSSRIVNGTSVQSGVHQMRYDVVVGSSMEDITISAGTFRTLMITSTNGTGARDVLWWSSKAQNFVLEKKYDAMSSQPNTILELKEFNSSSGDGTVIAILVGMALVAVAIVILAVILRARRPRQPEPHRPDNDAGSVRTQAPPSKPKVVKAPAESGKRPMP